MNRPSIARSSVALLAAFSLGLVGCRNLNHAGNGALVGSGLGAATGAIIGHQGGHREGGAVLGAAAGALAGGLLGEAEDARNQRDAAVAQAQFSQQALQAERVALTNAEIVSMAQNGLSDAFIIETIRQRGGRFDVSTQSIIGLKSSGVSEPVLIAMQTTAPPAVAAAPPTVVVAPPGPDVVVVPSAPRVGIGVTFGPGRRFHRRHWHRHHHHW